MDTTDTLTATAADDDALALLDDDDDQQQLAAIDDDEDDDPGGSGPHYPFEPLHRVIAARLGLPYCPGVKNCPGCSQQIHAGPAAAARYLGKSTTAPYRWNERGGIPEATADALALSIGLHPMLIPGWDTIVLDAVAAAAECGDCEPLDRDDPWLAQGELFPGWDGAGPPIDQLLRTA